jgi:hypothetical protein
MKVRGPNLKPRILIPRILLLYKVLKSQKRGYHPLFDLSQAFFLAIHAIGHNEPALTNTP